MADPSKDPERGQLPRWLSFEDRYHRDPTLKAVTDMLTNVILRMDLTPTEVREAAVFACIQAESRRMRPVFISVASRDEALRNIAHLKYFLEDLVPADDPRRYGR